MAKRHIYKKSKSGETIPITKRQLDNLLFDRKGKLKSRDYRDLRNMELVESSVQDAINELKEYSSLAYIPRALNNRDVNDAIVQMFFIGKWRVNKLSLWAEPEDIMHYGDDFKSHNSAIF